MLSTITHPSRRAQREGRKREEALELLGEMRAAGLTPDAVSFTSAIDACLKRGRWHGKRFSAGGNARVGSCPRRRHLPCLDGRVRKMHPSLVVVA
ncbi:unnamed protein product [Ectocarpus sp. 8 AP-2014]